MTVIECLKLVHCIECAEEFTSKLPLDKHFKNVHATSSYICSSCGFRPASQPIPSSIRFFLYFGGSKVSFKEERKLDLLVRATSGST